MSKYIIKSISFVTLALIFLSQNLYSMEAETGRPIARNMNTSHILKKTTEEDWKDNNGKIAPPRFRSAADDLWKSVEEEAAIEWTMGYGIYTKHPVTCTRIFCDIVCCGLPECCSCINPNLNKIGTWGLHNLRANNGNYEINKIKREKKIEEVKTEFKNYKEILNKSVKNPVNYSGDIKLWTKDKNRVEDGVRDYLDGSLVSARRDLINLYEESIIFLNSHGGWSDDPFSAVNAKIVGDTIYVDL